jgi:type IV secretory pathway VirJ component
VIAAALALGAVLAAAGPAGPPRSEADAGFGSVAVALPEAAPRRVVLLLSAAGGPTGDLGALARALAGAGALVATVDTGAWLRARAARGCAYPAGDLEALAQRLEKSHGLAAYLRPLVVGEGEGATLAWAALAQGPPGTFAGGVALGGLPERPLPVRLCAGDGPRPIRAEGGDVPALAPAAAHLEPAPARDPAAVARTLERLESAAPPPPPPPPAVGDLPVVEVPAAGEDPRLAVLLTGDGGWVGIDRALAEAFAEAGVATVGLDSLRYFWKRRTPDETARDVARIVAHYGAAWGRTEVVLVGYSRGADLVPFLATRLPPGARERVRLVAMLGPGTLAEFEVHAIDLLSSVRRASSLSTEEAVRAAAGAVPMLCVQGADERDSLCPRLADLPGVRRAALPGGHHFDRRYRELARLVLDAADERARGPAPGGAR